MANIASVEVVAAVNKAVADFQQAGNQIAKVMRDIAASNQPVQQAAQQTAKAHDGLLGTIKGFANEQRQQGRMARFYAGEILSIVPAAEGAKGAIEGLIGVGVEGLAGGFGFGLAFEAVKLAIHGFKMLGEEERKAKEELGKWFDEMDKRHADSAKKLQDLIDKFNELKDSQKTQREAAGVKAQIDAKNAQIASAEAELATLDATSPDEFADAADLSAMQKATALREKVAEWRQEVEKLERAYGDLGQTASVQGALELKEADRAAGKVREAREAMEAKERLDRAQGQGARDVFNLSASGQVEGVREDTSKTSGQVAAEYDKRRAERDKKLGESGTVDAYTANFELPQDQEGKSAAVAAAAAYTEQLRQAAEAQKALAQATRDTTQTAITMGQTFGDALAGMMTGTKSVGQAFAQIGQQIVRIIVDIAIKSITANAASAAAGAASSQAGIPIIGPALAIAAMGAMLTAVLGLIGNVASYDVGTMSVPRDMLAMVHQGETIVPASMADSIRKGDAVLGSPGSGGGGNVSIAISALDGADVMRVVRSREFRDALNEARRNGEIA